MNQGLDLDAELVQRARRTIHGGNVQRDADAVAVEIDGYDLIREIGRGGQGIVYQAIQRSTRRYVAIKILRHGMLASTGELARLEREVRILAQLRHPGLVAVHDSGRCGSLSYIVMDYIDGTPLDLYVSQARPTLRELLSLFAEIASAVHAAHLRGVIHRDLKPANIRVDADGYPHVLDFGIAKLLEADSPLATLTVTGQFVGSLPWAAPEQARGDSVGIDARTDVYALGVIFWQTLARSFPYPVDGDVNRVMESILNVNPTRASGRETMPFDVETILRTCLAKDPKRRYQSAGELAADLRNYLENRPIAARRDSQWYVLRKTVARHRVVFSLAGVIFAMAVLAAVGLGMLYILAERSATLATERANRLREALYYNSITLGERAFEIGNPIELNAALSQCPPEMRGWEYWHLKRLTDESVLSWRAHQTFDSNVCGQMLSPDGAYLLTTGLESPRFPPVIRTTKVWDAHTGELIRVLDADNVALQGSAAFSPDGKLIVVGGRTFRYRVYEANDWNLLYEADRGRRAAHHATTLIAFSGDSSRIVVGDGYQGGVDVHDARTGEFQRRLDQSYPVAVDVHPDGTKIIIGSIDGTASIWDLETGNRLAHLTGHGTQVRGVAFAPDGTYAVTNAWDGRLRGWEVPGGAQRFVSEAHPDASVALWGIGFSPDSRYLARCVSTWIELWDALRAQRIRRLIGHEVTTLTTAFSPDSSRVFGIARDGTVRVWSLNGGRGKRTISHGGEVVAWSSDGRWIAVFGHGDRLRLYDALSEQVVWEQQVSAPAQWATDVIFSPDCTLLAYSGMSTDIEFREVSTGRLARTIYAHFGRAGKLAWSRDGRRLASLGTDQFLRVWDIASGELVLEMLVGTSEVVMGTTFAIEFSPDGSRVVASARDGAVRIWRIEDGQLLLTLTGHSDTVGGLRYTSSGDRLISCSRDGAIRVWDARSGECLRTLRGVRNTLHHLALSPDDRHVFAAGDDLRLWDIDMGRQVMRISDNRIFHVALSPDGHKLAGISEGGLFIWDGAPFE